MADTHLSRTIEDLLWSAWTELGVPGVIRHHRDCAIDPEPLIVFSPALVSNEPRLDGQIKIWCGRHGDRISKTRLVGLRRRAPEAVQRAFDGLVSDMSGFGEPRSARHGRTRQDAKGFPAIAPPPLERAALVRLRMRALSGVGARADVLCSLAAASQTSRWLAASDLVPLGFSKRSVARVLEDLFDAGLAVSRTKGNVRLFAARDPDGLLALVGGEELRWLSWLPILELCFCLIELEAQGDQALSVRLVAANTARHHLEQLAHRANLQPPPSTIGSPTAFESVLAWGADAVASTAERQPEAAAHPQ